MYGGKSNDLIDGFGGKDTNYGGQSGDGSAEGVDSPRFPPDERDIPNVEGGEDSDTVYGEPGPNFTDAARNDNPLQSPFTRVDSRLGGDGNDHIWAVDDHVDIVNCGQGEFDSAYPDLYDTDVTNCASWVPVSSTSEPPKEGQGSSGPRPVLLRKRLMYRHYRANHWETYGPHERPQQEDRLKLDPIRQGRQGTLVPLEANHQDKGTR